VMGKKIKTYDADSTGTVNWNKGYNQALQDIANLFGDD